jgi:hypothetical protein
MRKQYDGEECVHEMQEEREDCGNDRGVKGNFARNKNVKSKKKR